MAVTRALDWLLRNRVRVIGLSLAGGDNEILSRAVAAATAQGGVLVAAAGNDRDRAAPRFPAGYEGVLAVTAVDARERAYRSANRGPHLDFAAPGVQVWAAQAGSRGGGFFTGTSFATPFVVAAAAVAIQGGDSASEVKSRLAGVARDLGAAGPDEIYGAGLVQIDPRDCR